MRSAYLRSEYLPSFRVRYRFFGADEGGRRAPPRQHTRWDFVYEADDPRAGGVSMIWPEFVDTNGQVLGEGPVPMEGIADMFIFDPTRYAHHKSRIALGTRGFFVEGEHRVAACEVVALLGLGAVSCA